MLFEIIIGIIPAAIPLSITFVLAGIGEMFNQRAGVYNLGAEGIMMVGAFLGFYVEYVMQSGPGSSILGLLAAGCGRGGCCHGCPGPFREVKYHGSCSTGQALL
jgi:ABC-type uncharacterized transport system permease subunit